MPAIWRIWVMFPRAPEPTIMSIGLNRWLANSFSIAAWTSAVASVQMRTSWRRRSPSVMTPRRNCCSTRSACSSCLSRISRLLAGVLTSSIDTVSPDCEANR